MVEDVKNGGWFALRRKEFSYHQDKKIKKDVCASDVVFDTHLLCYQIQASFLKGSLLKFNKNIIQFFFAVGLCVSSRELLSMQKPGDIKEPLKAVEQPKDLGKPGLVGSSASRLGRVLEASAQAGQQVLGRALGGQHSKTALAATNSATAREPKNSVLQASPPAGLAPAPSSLGSKASSPPATHAFRARVVPAPVAGQQASGAVVGASTKRQANVNNLAQVISGLSLSAGASPASPAVVSSAPQGTEHGQAAGDFENPEGQEQGGQPEASVSAFSRFWAVLYMCCDLVAQQAGGTPSELTGYSPEELQAMEITPVPVVGPECFQAAKVNPQVTDTLVRSWATRCADSTRQVGNVILYNEFMRLMRNAGEVYVLKELFEAGEFSGLNQLFSDSVCECLRMVLSRDFACLGNQMANLTGVDAQKLLLITAAATAIADLGWSAKDLIKLLVEHAET
jgi:hypothetical protein